MLTKPIISQMSTVTLTLMLKISLLRILINKNKRDFLRVCELVLAPLPLANSIICFPSAKAKPQYLFFQGVNTELPRKTISCWVGIL